MVLAVPWYARRMKVRMAINCGFGDIAYVLPHEKDAEIARLIAAAPELLQACRIIVNAFDALPSASTARNESLQINAARVAIAKATGDAA